MDELKSGHVNTTPTVSRVFRPLDPDFYAAPLAYHAAVKLTDAAGDSKIYGFSSDGVRLESKEDYEGWGCHKVVIASGNLAYENAASIIKQARDFDRFQGDNYSGLSALLPKVSNQDNTYGAVCYGFVDYVVAQLHMHGSRINREGFQFDFDGISDEILNPENNDLQNKTYSNDWSNFNNTPNGSGDDYSDTDGGDGINEIASEELAGYFSQQDSPFLATNQSVYQGVTSGYSLYQAIETGDALSIAQNTVNLVQNIDKYIETVSEGAGDFIPQGMQGALNGVGTGLNFVGNLLDLTDSLGSGDLLDIAGDLASTVGSGIDAFNIVTSAAEPSNFLGSIQVGGGVGLSPLLAVNVGLELLEGDTFGAMKTAAVGVATSVMLACGPYGWAGALALNAASMIIDSLMPQSIPKGSVDFKLGADGEFDYSIGGSAFKDACQDIGNGLAPMLKSMHDAGFDLDINGIPRVIVTPDDSFIESSAFYDPSVRIRNNCVNPEEFGRFYRDTIIARDGYQKVMHAVEASMYGGKSLTEVFGVRMAFIDGNHMDLAKLDAILAQYGLHRHGTHIQSGWQRPAFVDWEVQGTGQYVGGGNVGGRRGEVMIQAVVDIASGPTEYLLAA